MRLLSTGELARELGVSRASVLKWANDGLIIPAFTTPGGHLRWDLDDVRRQVRELRERGAEGE
jgi:DNA-binding transcriptional MerR regulator